jgi:hypothetical protein
MLFNADAIRRLKTHGESLAAQDMVLRESREQAVGTPVVVGLKHEFETINSEFPGLIDPFSTASFTKEALRLQLVRALAHITSAVSHHEAGVTSPSQALDVVRQICRRLPQVIDQLTQRRQGRPTLNVGDEYDVQDLLHAVLRLHFDDVRPEEWTASYAGGASRMDFLLKDERVVIEAKMIRQGLTAREVSDQLIIDAARYISHQDCATLVCLVYDPHRFLRNPRGLESDIAKLSRDGLTVMCIITS